MPAGHTFLVVLLRFGRTYKLTVRSLFLTREISPTKPVLLRKLIAVGSAVKIDRIGYSSDYIVRRALSATFLRNLKTAVSR